MTGIQVLALFPPKGMHQQEAGTRIGAETCIMHSDEGMQVFQAMPSLIDQVPIPQ